MRLPQTKWSSAGELMGKGTRRDRTSIGRYGDGGVPWQAAMLHPCASAV